MLGQKYVREKGSERRQFGQEKLHTSDVIIQLVQFDFSFFFVCGICFFIIIRLFCNHVILSLSTTLKGPRKILLLTESPAYPKYYVRVRKLRDRKGLCLPSGRPTYPGLLIGSVYCIYNLSVMLYKIYQFSKRFHLCGSCFTIIKY